MAADIQNTTDNHAPQFRAEVLRRLHLGARHGHGLGIGAVVRVNFDKLGKPFS
jgi:hypothetical protein